MKDLPYIGPSQTHISRFSCSWTLFLNCFSGWFFSTVLSFCQQKLWNVTYFMFKPFLKIFFHVRFDRWMQSSNYLQEAESFFHFFCYPSLEELFILFTACMSLYNQYIWLHFSCYSFYKDLPHPWLLYILFFWSDCDVSYCLNLCGTNVSKLVHFVCSFMTHLVWRSHTDFLWNPEILNTPLRSHQRLSTLNLP